MYSRDTSRGNSREGGGENQSCAPPPGSAPSRGSTRKSSTSASRSRARPLADTRASCALSCRSAGAGMLGVGILVCGVASASWDGGLPNGDCWEDALLRRPPE